MPATYAIPENKENMQVSATGTEGTTSKPRGVGPRSGAKRNAPSSRPQGLNSHSCSDFRRHRVTSLAAADEIYRPSPPAAPIDRPAGPKATEEILLEPLADPRSPRADESPPSEKDGAMGKRRQPERQAARRAKDANNAICTRSPPSSATPAVVSSQRSTTGSGGLVGEETPYKTPQSSSHVFGRKRIAGAGRGTKDVKRKKENGQKKISRSPPATRSRSSSRCARGNAANQKTNLQNRQVSSAKTKKDSAVSTTRTPGRGGAPTLTGRSKGDAKQKSAMFTSGNWSPRAPDSFPSDFVFNLEDDGFTKGDDVVASTSATGVAEEHSDGAEHPTRGNSRGHRKSAKGAAKVQRSAPGSSSKREAAIGARGKKEKLVKGGKRATASGDKQKRVPARSRGDGDKRGAKDTSIVREGASLEELPALAAKEKPFVTARSRLSLPLPLYGYGGSSSDDEEMFGGGQLGQERRETGSWLMSDPDDDTDDSSLEADVTIASRTPGVGRQDNSGGGKSSAPHGKKSNVRRYVDGAASSVAGKISVRHRRSAGALTKGRRASSVDDSAGPASGVLSAAQEERRDSVAAPSFPGATVAGAVPVTSGSRRKSAPSEVGSDVGYEKQLEALRALYSKVDSHQLTLSR